ncbi:MAG TPA: ABC transporter ATP-binding protein [Actinospica sp.]|jgi:peptide/nickel transport system ATP-binding protein|nr:ABC transporter ATP-binding protein [Actinospica sp.]
MTALSVQGLRIHAGGRTLVHEVGFELAAGQTLGTVGESGSGKTLTVKAIAGVLPDGVSATGSVRLDGAELLGRSEREMRPLRGTRLAMVLQDPFTALNPVHTVAAHLRESLAADVRRDRRAADAEISRRLREVGLDADAVASRYPFQLSGGMRQRVAIAAALARDPALLIADEPTTALDVTTQAEVLALLRRLREERGMALILVTHDLRVAFDVCDRVLVMYAGSVLEDAPAAALATSPRHPYSHGLMRAEPPATHYVDRLDAIPGRVPPADEVGDVCGFAERCAWRTEICVSGRPSLVTVGPDHASACVRIEEIGDELGTRRQPPETPTDHPPVRRATPLLTLDGVSKTYRKGHAPALDGVSFELGEGESLGVVGESGSGKTTLARRILGLTPPGAGSIRLAGTEIADYRKLSRAESHAVRRTVQVVFQDPYSSLNPRLSVGTALREAAQASGGPQAVGELLDLVGLPAGYARLRPGSLSGGERQRVAIARALAVRPRLLICDEPVAALDVSVQAQILELLREVRRVRETALLFITHDLSVVRQMADRVIVLRHGAIVEHGETAALLDTPQHPYTARLIESIPGNG